MKNSNHALSLFFLIVFSVAYAIAQEIGKSEGPYTISGMITGVRPNFEVRIALYSSQENYKSRKYTKAIKIVKDKVAGDTLWFTFHGIKAGDYMVAAYQDLNGDGKINFNFLGIPTEPYAFYKKCENGRPGYEKCKFKITDNFSGADLRFMQQE